MTLTWMFEEVVKISEAPCLGWPGEGGGGDLRVVKMAELLQTSPHGCQGLGGRHVPSVTRQCSGCPGGVSVQAGGGQRC